jgi:hypothetical protein
MNEIYALNFGAMTLVGETRKTRTKACPNIGSSTTNPAWAALGSNPFFWQSFTLKINARVVYK